MHVDTKLNVNDKVWVLIEFERDIYTDGKHLFIRVKVPSKKAYRIVKATYEEECFYPPVSTGESYYVDIPRKFDENKEEIDIERTCGPDDLYKTLKEANEACVQFHKDILQSLNEHNKQPVTYDDLEKAAAYYAQDRVF